VIKNDLPPRPLTAAELENVATKTKELKLKGRLMPDSAITTFFGKPAWHAYGHANINPA